MAFNLVTILTLLSAICLTGVRAVIRGPLLNVDFPDPAVIQRNGVWYAFGTQSIYDNRNIKIQLATSQDFSKWTLVKDYDALPRLPSWAVDGGNTWAPDIVQLPNGTFLMYFAATAAADQSKHCIGTATSKNIAGPYVASQTPFDCALSEGGSIDPAGFLDPDSGKRYVVWKLDGNSLGHGGSCNNGVEPIVKTYIVAQQVSVSDGVTKIGQRVTLLQNDKADGPLVEAPSLIKRGDVYVLFFSNNCYTSPQYKTSYASLRGASSPLAMFTKSPRSLLTQRNNGLSGPGGMDTTAPGNRALFHVLQSDGRRFLYSADLSYFPNGWGEGSMRVDI